ncbi:MAG: hypothetical protein HY863_15750 [Chloroflexi bacterium]|nr:hypothetical protein [Chloroflexota bacterium]
MTTFDGTPAAAPSTPVSNVTAAQIAKVRRMCKERNSTSYSDEDIQAFIEAYPLVDIYGYDYRDSQNYYPINPDWTPTYDLNAAAADIWEEKAGEKADEFDFSADGASYSRSQKYENAMKQARYFRSRRSHKTMQMQASPKRPLSPEELDSDDSN